MRHTTLAAVLAVPTALALAPVAHADGQGLAVNFNPTLGGMRVTITDATNFPQGQNCTYTAVSAGGLGSLVPPTVAKPFSLAPGGSATLNFPGIPTGTVYDTHIECDWQGPPPAAPARPRPQAGFFSQVVTY